MAPYSVLAADDQIVAMLPNINTIEPGSALAILIPLIDSLILDEVGRDVVQQAYTDEPHDISEHLTWDNMIVRGADLFQVNHPPVDTSSDHTLKVVVSRDSNGDPSTISTVAKNKYYVDPGSSVVTLVKSPYASDVDSVLSGMFGAGVFVEGKGTILFSYTGGWATVPPRLTLALINEIARYHALFGSNLMHIVSQSGQFGFSKYLRQGLSPETMDILARFKMPVTV